MKIVREGPEQAYEAECPSCDSLIQYTKFDLITIKKWSGNAWEVEWNYHVGLKCPVCNVGFWTEQTDTMYPIKRKEA